MGLRDLVIPTEVVKVADGEFTVRGLSPNDALGLYYRHAGQLSALFDQFTARSRTGEDVNVAEVGTSLVGGAPQIMAEIIAVASGSRAPRLDEPDIVKRAAQETEWLLDVQKAIDLPAGAQMDALEKVGKLTFTSEMPPKKFFGLVLAMAQSATAAINAPKG
jgi:hypothetical protein